MTNVLVVGCPFVLSLVRWALQDLDKTQEDVLKHQASISELKRSFMEATPEPRPSQWDKRLTGSPATSLRLQAQGVRVLVLGFRRRHALAVLHLLLFSRWVTVGAVCCTLGQLGTCSQQVFIFILLN